MPVPTVAIIGGGFSGTMTAAQLLRQATARGRALRVVVFDRAAAFAAGVAYRTTDDRHLLNVPAGKMSAWPDRPDSFLDWARARETPGPAYVESSGRNVLAAQFAALAERKDLLIVDTAAGAVEAVGEAVVVADFVLMVARPTLIDLSGLARTLMLVRRLGKPSAVVVNQAPVTRENVEAPLVRRAMKGLDYMKADVAPAILRSRAIYQVALERGRSVEESSDRAAAAEVAALWDYVAATMGLTVAAP